MQKEVEMNFPEKMNAPKKINHLLGHIASGNHIYTCHDMRMNCMLQQNDLKRLVLWIVLDLLI